LGENLMLRYNTAERIKVTLITSLGAPKTGLIATDFKASSVYLYKSDGTKTTIALTLGVNLFEADSTDAPGVYDILLTSTHTNTLGTICISIQPAAAAFVATYFTETVEDTVSGISTLIGTPVVSVSADIASVYSRLGAPAGASVSADVAAVKADTTTLKADTAATVAVLPLTTIAAATDVTASTTAIKGTDNRSITDIAGVGTFNLATDTLHDIKTAIGGFATTADVNAARDSIKGPDNRDLTQMAGAGFVSANDSLIALKTAIGGVAGATAAQVFDELLNLHIAPGSFGEFMNILSAIMLNRVRMDKLTKTLTVFQADNVTPLKTYPLYDLNGNPALLNASERGKAI
jgi:hypothetical protein